MLRGAFASAGNESPSALEAAYADVLGETIDALGVDAVAERAGVDPERIRAVRDGTVADLTLAEATAILATDPDRPDPDTLAAEARDLLLMGMTTAVLDVEALASKLDDRLEPKEIQQKVEGRRSMTLSEYALLHHHLAGATG